MTPFPIRKIYLGIADRRQMFRLFDRHEQRPNAQRPDESAQYAGEWFEVADDVHQYMLDILPPLWMEWGMFALCRPLTGALTSIFFNLKIDDRYRYFHGYCDLAAKGSPERMRDAIIERESRPIQALTREERIEHIWSAAPDEFRGYADRRFPREQRGKRIIMVFGPARSQDFKLLEQLTDAEIAAKLPARLRYLPDPIAA